jgi:hypothetical protein
MKPLELQNPTGARVAIKLMDRRYVINIKVREVPLGCDAQSVIQFPAPNHPTPCQHR